MKRTNAEVLGEISNKIIESEKTATIKYKYVHTYVYGNKNINNYRKCV